jgi:hypothetical protein
VIFEDLDLEISDEMESQHHNDYTGIRFDTKKITNVCIRQRVERNPPIPSPPPPPSRVPGASVMIQLCSEHGVVKTNLPVAQTSEQTESVFKSVI